MIKKKKPLVVRSAAPPGAAPPGAAPPGAAPPGAAPPGAAPSDGEGSESRQEADLAPSLDVVIEITKDAIAGVDNTLNAQDTKGLFVAASATAIVALVAPTLEKFPIWVCIMYATLYVIVLIASLFVYHPRIFILSTADPILSKKNFLKLPEHESNQNLLEILQNIYIKNHANMCKKGVWIKYSFFLLNIFIVASIVLIFEPVLFRGGDKHADQPATGQSKRRNPGEAPSPGPARAVKPAT